jgi:hypothetical protein
VALPPLTPHEQIFEAFSHYLHEERGLAPKSIIRHLPVIRRFFAAPGKVRPLAIPQIVGIAQSQFQTAIRKPETAEQSTTLTPSINLPLSRSSEPRSN